MVAGDELRRQQNWIEQSATERRFLWGGSPEPPGRRPLHTALPRRAGLETRPTK
jgi:hypothetical protein